MGPKWREQQQNLAVQRAGPVFLFCDTKGVHPHRLATHNSVESPRLPALAHLRLRWLCQAGQRVRVFDLHMHERYHDTRSTAQGLCALPLPSYLPTPPPPPSLHCPTHTHSLSLSVATCTSPLLTAHFPSGAKAGWNLAWQTMVKELAPQDKTGSYNRPGYAFDNKIGSPQFPVSPAWLFPWLP